LVLSVGVAEAQPRAAIGQPLPDANLAVGTVSVRVLDGTPSRPAVNVVVSLAISGGKARTIPTDASGRAVFEGTTAEWQYNPLGTVHGGWISTLLDSALGCAVHSMLQPGQLYTTLDLQVRFVRALHATSGTVRAEAKTVHTGKRVGTAEARLVGTDGTLYATATTSCIITSL
jgi:uncharacterized protein (TIGR00369 family)